MPKGYDPTFDYAPGTSGYKLQHPAVPQEQVNQQIASAIAANNKANQFGNNGAPTRPTYNNPVTYSPEKGYSLPEQYQLNPNYDALNAARSYATSQGPSPWAGMQTQQLDASLPGRQNQLNSQITGAGTTARQGLMGEGGLSAAAGNRFDKRTNLAQMMGGQNLAQQNDLAKQDIASTDLQQKQAMLSALPGLENQALAPQQFNIQKIIEQNALANQDSVQKYKTDMAAWSAANTSNAYSNSGGKK